MRTGVVRGGLPWLMVTALWMPVLAGQEPVSLKGVVFDPTNRLMPAVTISLTPEASPSESRTTQTDGQGRYEFSGLRAGAYRFEAARAGFRTVTLVVNVASPAEHSVRMSVGTLREEMEIVASMDDARPPTRRGATDVPPGASTPAADPCAAGRPGRVGGIIAPPQKTRHVSPRYPDALRKARLGGRIEIHATLGVDGHVSNLRTDAPQASALLEATAAAISQWEFLPARLNCEPVAVEIHVIARFDPNR